MMGSYRRLSLVNWCGRAYFVHVICYRFITTCDKWGKQWNLELQKRVSELPTPFVYAGKYFSEKEPMGDRKEEPTVTLHPQDLPSLSSIVSKEIK